MKTFNIPQMQAMVDIVVDDNHGFEGIRNLDTAKTVLEKVISRLSDPSEILDRLHNSRHDSELIRHLFRTLEHKREILEPYVQPLLVSAEKWSYEILEEFAGLYWSIRVRERICRGDFKRAWDELRKAYQGFDPKAPEPFECIQAGEPNKLAVSYGCIAKLLIEMYGAMHKKRLVGEISNNAIPFNNLVGPGHKAYLDAPLYRFPEKPRRLFPGEVFVRAMMEKGGMVPASGQAAYQIAKHLSSKRNDKRKRKTEKVMNK